MSLTVRRITDLLLMPTGIKRRGGGYTREGSPPPTIFRLLAPMPAILKFSMYAWPLFVPPADSRGPVGTSLPSVPAPRPSPSPTARECPASPPPSPGHLPQSLIFHALNPGCCRYCCCTLQTCAWSVLIFFSHSVMSDEAKSKI